MKAFPLTQSLTPVHVEQLAGQFALPDMTLPFLGSRRKMPMHRIVRLEGEGNYTLFHFSDGSHLMVSLTLKKLEERLSDKVFVRPHKKNIINLLYLEALHPENQQLSVSLVNGDRIEVSRRKVSAFMKQVRGFQEELLLLSATPFAFSQVAA